MNTDTAELNSGLLIMGMSNTLFFGEGIVHELVLVDLSNGKDFSLPISEEQAQLLHAHVFADTASHNGATEGANAAENDAWNASEATPQL